MRKIVSLFLSVVMLLSLFAMPAMATVEDGVVLLDMDFDNDVTGNYLAKLSKTSVAKVFTAADNANVTVSNIDETVADGAATADASSRGYIGVIDVSSDETLKTNTALNNGAHTKVFKYQHQTYTSSNFLSMKLLPNKGANADMSNHTVVTEYDMYFEPQTQQVGIPGISYEKDNKTQYFGNDDALFVFSDGKYIRYYSPNGGGNYAVDGTTTEFGVFDMQNLSGGWHNIKTVRDMTTKSGVVTDTYRIYIDGTLIGTKFANSTVPLYDLLGNAKFDYALNFADTFYGIAMGGKIGGTTNPGGAIYFDNVKVTKYPGKFEVSGQTVNGTDLTVTFNRNIDASTKDNAYVIDADGTKVNATISASGKTLTVSGLADKTAYKLVLPATFTDELGQGLVTFYVNNSTSDAYAAYKSSDKVLAFTTGTSPVKVTTLIDQNFESSVLNTKVFANIEDANVNTVATKIIKPSDSPVPGIGAILITNKPYESAAAYIASADLSVVNTTVGDITGNFLRYNNNSGAADAVGDRNQVIGTIAPQTTDSAELNIKGSILVTEYDIFIEPKAKGSNNDGAVMAPATLDITKRDNYGSSAPYMSYPTDATRSITLKGTKSDVDATNTDVKETISGWTKVRIVTDLTGETTYARVYIGDTLMSLNSNHDFRTFDRWGRYTIPATFTGLSFGGYGAGTGAIYYDNINVYKVNKDFAIAEKTDDIFAAFGKDDTASITFTTDVDETTVDKLYLAKADGTKVDGGITATVDSADAKKVNITLGDEVAKGTYKIVIPATFTDIYGQGIGTYGDETEEIAVTATDVVIEKAATIYEEDFEDWNNDNLLTTATEGSTNYYTANAAKTGANAITVGVYDQSSNLDTTGVKMYVGAVDAATEGVDENGRHTGNVLKYTNTTDSKFLMVNLGEGNTDLTGKITVVESEVFIPSGISINETQMPTVSHSKNYSDYHASNISFSLQGSSKIVAQSGKYDTATDRSANETYIHKSGKVVPSKGAWHKLKVVYTDKGTAVTGTNPDTWRAYFDGEIMDGKFLKKTEGTALETTYDYEQKNYNYINGQGFSNYNIGNTFYGILIGGKGISGSAEGDLYFDNIKVYTVNTPFAVTTATRDASKFNAVADVITMTFTQPVDKETVKNIQIVDKAGETLDAIKEVNYKDSNTVMEIQLDSDKLLGKEVYKVVLPATFTDVYGQGLVTYYNPYRSSETAKGDSVWYDDKVPANADTLAVTLTTAKATEIYIDDVTDGYLNGTFTKTVTVNSVATETLPVWIAAAAYDAENNMVGFCAVDEFTLAAGATTYKDLDFTVEAGKTAKYVRVFVWNGKDTMKPYQAIEEITVQ